MSECAGAHTINSPEGMDFKSVGYNLSGLETKIVNIEGEEHGEVIVYPYVVIHKIIILFMCNFNVTTYCFSYFTTFI